MHKTILRQTDSREGGYKINTTQILQCGIANNLCCLNKKLFKILLEFEIKNCKYK